MKHVLPYALLGGFLLFSLLTIFSGSAAEGDQEVLRIDFSGLSGPTEGPLTGVGAASIDNIRLSRGPGLGAASAPNGFNSTNWNATAGNFLSLDFEVAEGQALHVRTLTLAGQSSGGGPRDMAIFSSTDGFTTPVATWVQISSAAPQTLDMSALPPLRGTVSLRIMPTSNVSANGGTVASGGTFRLTNTTSVDGLQLTGMLIGQEEGAGPDQPVAPEPENPEEPGEPDNPEEPGEPENPETPGDLPANPEENTLARIFWDLSGQPGNQAFTPGSAEPDQIIVFDLERSSSISATAANNSITANGFNTEEERFFTFGFRVPDGFTFTGEKLLLTTRSSAGGPGNLAVQSSIDGFTSSLAEITQTTNDFIVTEIDLSTLGIVRGEVRFRVAAVGQTAANGNSIGSTGTLRIANTRTEGTVFVPLTITGTLAETEVEPEPSLDPVTLLQYDLAGQPGNQASTEPVVLVSGISGQPLTRGAGLAASGSGNSFSSSGWNAGEERFFRFGFTALPGQSVDLSSLRFGYRSSNTGPTNMALRYSGDNFTQNLATFTSVNAFGNLEVDLSALQG
ncbi:hypothetical protein A3SI_17242 [Nitritalea halalkaliphila LW7]|uniref:Uncharacterized protein n=1 Tax=Nitritalea halalkaliphila LW7 TaxID=1189621 RepID=I5BW56_9BACT|nr:hypothetical protein [Nitritalea halalkaliphila]EIM73808.1 hypothetical protein A3SI_17242 [Nitritalea halalkaliphila LW7]